MQRSPLRTKILLRFTQPEAMPPAGLYIAMQKKSGSGRGCECVVYDCQLASNGGDGLDQQLQVSVASWGQAADLLEHAAEIFFICIPNGMCDAGNAKICGF